MFKLVVLTCVLAMASASAVAPLGWAGAGWGGWAGQRVAAPWAARVAAPWAAPVATTWAAPVAASWAAPVATSWVAPGAHVIHKRSAVLVAAPVAWSSPGGLAVSTRLAAPLSVAPLAANPLVGAWGAAPWARAGVWGAHW